MTVIVLSQKLTSQCLGGDGTLKYASSLFTESISPKMSFNLGPVNINTSINQPRLVQTRYKLEKALWDSLLLTTLTNSEII